MLLNLARLFIALNHDLETKVETIAGAVTTHKHRFFGTKSQKSAHVSVCCSSQDSEP